MGLFDFLTNQAAPSAPQGPASPRPPTDSSWQIRPLDDEALDELHSQIKSAKLSRDKVQQAIDLVSSGQALPGTREYYHALGIGAAQQGLKPADSYGGLGWLGNMFDPKAAELRRVQDVADNIGNAALKATVDLHTSQIGAPKTIAEAEAAAPGAVTPTAAQRFSPAPYAEGIGITPPANPGARLLPFQRAQAVNTATGLAQGHLMRTDEGIVPANYATYNGRYMMDPTDVVSSVKAATGVDIQPPAKPVPATNVNSMIQAISAGNRQDQRLDRPTLHPDVNAQAMAMFGMPYYDIQDPSKQQMVLERVQGLRKDMKQFENDQYAKRQLAVAPVVAAAQETARKEADRDQPLSEPQLWRNPDTGDAAPASMTTRQAQDKGYVKVRPDQVETINQYATIDDGLNQVKDIAERILSPNAKTPLGNAWRALSQTAKLAYLRAIGDKDVMMMDSIITRLTAPLVKSQGDTANIAVAEREMFKHALVNNQASTEAVVANLDNVIKTSNQVRKSMGFRITHPEWQDKGKKAPAQGQDKTEDQARARIQELKAKGLSKEAIKSRLLKEGFK